MQLYNYVGCALLGLTICGVNCLMSAEWKSASKVVARTGQGDGKGDVILKTKTGGVGTCTVQFNAIPFIPGTMHSEYLFKLICFIYIYTLYIYIYIYILLNM